MKQNNKNNNNKKVIFHLIIIKMILLNFIFKYVTLIQILKQFLIFNLQITTVKQKINKLIK